MLILVHEHSGGTELLVNTDYIVVAAPESNGTLLEFSEKITLGQRDKTVWVNEDFRSILEAIKLQSRPG